MEQQETIEHSVKEKNMVGPGLVERTQEQAIAEPQLTDVAPVLIPSVPVASNENTPQESQIRELAFQLYEERGRDDGHDLDDWLQAEAILISQQKRAA